MPGRKRSVRKVWVWLTVQQIDAVLLVAQAFDATPEALEAALPLAGDRFAYRGAIAELRKVRGAMKTSE